MIDFLRKKISAIRKEFHHHFAAGSLLSPLHGALRLDNQKAAMIAMTAMIAMRMITRR